MDSFFITMEDPKVLRVGEKSVFKGEAGLNVKRLDLFIDDFPIGEATFFITPNSDRKTWALEYTFKGAGMDRELSLIYDNGFVTTRRQFINVESAINKPKKSIVKIVESKVKHTTQGAMELQGLVVHYTAGQQSTDPSGAINMANDPEHAPYAYWVMAADGTIYKTHELNRWGYHCATSHHRTHLGIEIMCPGKLTRFENKFYPWFNLDRTGNPKGPAWPEDQIRQFLGNRLQTPGYYAKYTEAQERALIGLIQYLKDNCPKFKIDNVVGHDEILPDWKDDPGGSLSMSMPDFRKHLMAVII